MADRQLDDIRSRRLTEEDIAMRADQRYFERGALDGHDVEDWHQAEREIRESRSARGRSDEGESFV
jgi:Protein of unknown function (DUF2934)